MDKLIVPNLHVALIHFPIGLLLIGSFIEIFSFLGWRQSSFRVAGRWMILLGAFFAVVATFTGLYALATEAPDGIKALLANPSTAALGESLRSHLWVQVGATSCAMLIVVLWIASSNRMRDLLHYPLALLLIATCSATLWGSHVGGKIVYVHRLGEVKYAPATLPTSQPNDHSLQSYLNQASQVIEPDELHLLLSGVAIAMATICIGLSLRLTCQSHDETQESLQRIADAFSTKPRQSDEFAGLLDDEPAIKTINHTPTWPAGRFWLLATVALLVTGFSGAWIVSHDIQSLDIQKLWTEVITPIDETAGMTRRYAHLISGIVLVADTLILAILARIASRNRLVLLMFLLPLILAILAQVWLGVLLLFEGPAGSLTAFSGK